MKFFRTAIGWLLTWFVFIGLIALFFILYRYGWSLYIVLLLAFYLLNLITIGVIFVQNRHPQAKLSWMLFIITFPLFGPLLYVIFGRKFKKSIAVKDYIASHVGLHKTNVKNSDLPPELAFLKKQETLVAKRFVPSKMTFFNNTNAAYEMMFRDMQRAQRSIHANYYILKKGEVWDKFKKILLEKVQAGVAVRFIIDDFGRWAMPWYEIKNMQKHGVQIVIFAKVHFPFLSYKNGYRNHKKMLLIDNEIVYTGGSNISDEYVSYSKRYGAWEDLNIKLEGSIVQQYAKLFIFDWHQNTQEQLKLQKLTSFQKADYNSKSLMVEDGPNINYPILENTLVNLIFSAKKSIKLATPYFVPTNKIVSALKYAALSGVDVEIYIPGKEDKKSVFLASKYHARDLEKSGIKVYSLKNVFLHTKAGLFDHKYAYIGTMNLDIRSLYSQFEMINIFYGSEAIKRLEAVFKNYQNRSVKLKYQNLGYSSLFVQMQILFIKITAPLM